MKTHYLFEVVQRQTLYISTEASSKEQAIHQVKHQQGKLEQPLPAELESINFVGGHKPHG